METQANELPAYPATPADRLVQVPIRMPVSLHARLKKHAQGSKSKGETTSMNQFCVTAIENELDARTPDFLTAKALADAIKHGGYDVSRCGSCGTTVVCIPDGLPMCEKCAMAEAVNQ